MAKPRRGPPFSLGANVANFLAKSEEARVASKQIREQSEASRIRRQKQYEVVSKTPTATPRRKRQ